MSKAESRALWIWLHRYIGLVAMLFLGFAAITGCMLCFLRPLDAAINADLFKAPPVSAPMDVPLAVDRFQARHPELFVRSFPLAVPANRTIAVKVEPASKSTKLGLIRCFSTAADGIWWERAPTMRVESARREVLLHDIHYTLLAQRGQMAMGGIALPGCSAILSAPISPFRCASRSEDWKRMWRFSLGSAMPRMLLDMHRSSGLWLLLPLTALAFTSVRSISFPLLRTAVERLIPPKASPLESRAPYPQGVAGTLGFVRAVAMATRQAETGKRCGSRRRRSISRTASSTA